MKKTGALLVLALLLAAACIDFDVDEDFCANVDPVRRALLCGDGGPTPPGDPGPDAGSGGGDGGPTPPGPPGPDAGSGDGSCEPSIQCTTPPNPCHEPLGTCVSGQCSYPPKKAGTSCDDGQLCTVNDTCDGTGQCISGSPFVCDAPPGPCHEAVGTCATNTCTYQLKAVGTACDDGKKCTEADQCNSVGVCAGVNKVCNSPSGDCYQAEGSCNTDTGACTYPPRPNGATCAPANQCEVGACNGAGSCVTTGPVTCEEQPCSRVTGCDPSSGCTSDNWCFNAGGVCTSDCCRDISTDQCIREPPIP